LDLKQITAAVKGALQTSVNDKRGPRVTLWTMTASGATSPSGDSQLVLGREFSS
jgi:hypothetical protein